MKKLFTIFFLFLVSYSFGQSLKLVYEGRELQHGDSVTAVVTNMNSDNTFHFDIINLIEDTVKMQIKKQEITLLEGAENSFCVGIGCYSGNQSDIISIDPKDTLSHNTSESGYFYIQYNPKNVVGTSVFYYTILGVENATDTLGFYVVLESKPSGIKQHPNSIASLKAYPNPASSKVTIQYSVDKSRYSDLKLVIKNLMGVTVSANTLSADSESISVDISGLASGLYLYSIESAGVPLLTKKLSVR